MSDPQANKTPIKILQEFRETVKPAKSAVTILRAQRKAEAAIHQLLEEARLDELYMIDKRVAEDEAKGIFPSRSKYIRERQAELQANLASKEGTADE